MHACVHMLIYLYIVHILPFYLFLPSRFHQLCVCGSFVNAQTSQFLKQLDASAVYALYLKGMQIVDGNTNRLANSRQIGEKSRQSAGSCNLCYVTLCFYVYVYVCMYIVCMYT